MKKLILAVALAVAGCNNAPAPESTPAASVVDKVTIEGTRGLVLAELAYSAANGMAMAAVESGVLKGANAAKAREVNAAVTRALDLAHSTQNGAVRAKAVSDAFNGISALRALVGE